MFVMTFHAHAANCYTDDFHSSVVCGGNINNGPTNSVAIGNDAVRHDGATVVGAEAQANGWISTAMGIHAKADGDKAVALGADTVATGESSVAIGKDANSLKNGSVAVGNGASSLNADSVAIGSHSLSDRENEVSIGDEKSGLTRVLSNLAAGTKDNDAVNKKQMEEYTATEIGKLNLDTKLATADQNAKGYASNAVTEADGHTDGKIKALDLDTKLGTADQNARGYASNAVTEADGHTDGKIKALDLDTKLGTADQNAQGYASDVLKSANDNIERRAVSAENNAVTRSKAYTDERSDRTLESANIYTNHRAAQAENNAVARSNNYTDNRFSELRKNLEHTEKRLNAGIAGVTALSSIPYAAGNNFSYGIGAGNYQNGNAVAAGVQLRVSQSTNVRLNISWDSAGNNATGVGIAGGW
ncbi:TPA: hypothetical protein G8W61_002206 [Salmonella enterica]|uniref:Trimeric autotransporter adhesin YadA-like C-terminal membrane anchor domain-containing protein n=1 Tax=Salmonella enterica TaxID=28901 RepID=A0A759YMM4_SALER|nr:hypothetical protein [Salmonella enterica]